MNSNSYSQKPQGGPADRNGNDVAVALSTAAIDHAMALQALAAIGIEPRTVEGVTHVIVPKDFKREDLTEAIERRQGTPYRKRTKIAVQDLDSLLLYAREQGAEASGYIYADTANLKFVAVFNDNRGAAPGWRDHRCTYEAKHTPEFERWKANDRKQMSQLAFAEFIEDNLADLQGDASKTLLDVALTLSAGTDINFRSARRLDNGQVQLTYHENLDAKAGADGSLAIPKTFQLGMRVFRNGEGYIINARLKYRLRDGAVTLWYELDRVERVIEDAFKGYVDQVRTVSGYAVLIGSPD